MLNDVLEYPEFLDKIVEDFIIESTNMSVQRAACRLLLLTLPRGSNSKVFHFFVEILTGVNSVGIIDEPFYSQDLKFSQHSNHLVVG